MRLHSLLIPLCLSLPGPAAEWERVGPELELAFPADHGAHPRHQIEWWYVTGQLESQEGRRFGFQFTIFRSGLSPEPAAPGQSPLRARQVLAGHLALTDVQGERTLFAERLRRAGTPLARAAEGRLDLVLEDWSMALGEDEQLSISAADRAEGMALELELVPRKPLVLHGERGYSSKGSDPGNASAYYSWTRLATGGRIQLGQESFEVTGEAWFDHEFGTSVLEQGVIGWDWFGLQLGDGRELMLFVLRREDGTRAPASAGTLVAADGSSRALSAVDFRVEPRAEWTSPRSDATYPARWVISVPSADLELEVVPLVADCELDTGRSTGVAYWEGPVELRGPLGGRGYAELTGYAGSMGGLF